MTQLETPKIVSAKPPQAPRQIDIDIVDVCEPHVETVAKFLVTAFPDYLDAALGERCLASLLRERCMGPDRKTVCRIAIRKSDGACVSCCFCGLITPDGDAHLLVDREVARREVRRLIWTTPALWRYMLRWFYRKLFDRSSYEGRPPGAGMVASHLVVHPDCRGSNVGRDMMLDADEVARRYGVRRLCGVVHRDNYKAERLYASIGWVRSSPEAAHYTVFSMHKDL